MARIFKSDRDGVVTVRLEGYIRVNLCHTLREYISGLLERDQLSGFIVDLSQTEGLDSTALGTLVKLSQQLQQKFQLRSILVSVRQHITDLIKRMGFARVFDIRSEMPRGLHAEAMEEIPFSDAPVEVLRKEVIDVHRALIDMGVPESQEFTRLLTYLEQ